MSNGKKNISGPALAALLFGGSLLARKGIARAWTGVTHEPSPPEKDNADVDLAEAVTWAVVTGVAVGLLKFAIRRASYRGSPLERN